MIKLTTQSEAKRVILEKLQECGVLENGFRITSVIDNVIGYDTQDDFGNTYELCVISDGEFLSPDYAKEILLNECAYIEFRVFSPEHDHEQVLFELSYTVDRTFELN